MPCDSISILQTVFKMEHSDKLITAAKKLGFTAAKQRGEVVVTLPGGDEIRCQEGRTFVSRYEREAAEKLMKGYAEEVFSAWEQNYSQFQEVSREQDSRVYQFVGT